MRRPRPKFKVSVNVRIFNVHIDECKILLSPPNEVSEGTMKRAPYVCVSVCLCVCVSVRPGSKINEKCYFSVISWPILILFVLSDRAWCRLQNFYTEFWNSLIMQMYSKSMKNATSLSFLGRFWFCLFSLIGLGAGFKTSTQNFEIH